MAQKSISQPVTAARVNEFNSGKIWRDLMIRRVGRIGLYFNPVFSYFFLWAPILVLAVFSFNDSTSVSIWGGFTTRWYDGIFTSLTIASSGTTDSMLGALRNSLFVASIATVVSSIIGTMVALSLARGRYPGKRALDAVLYLPVVIPEIAQGVSLAIFFSAIFSYINTVTGQHATYGFGTIIIAHVAFNISYVAIVVRARLASMNPRLEEAARDLGANEWRTFWHVTFPQLVPGVLAGGLLALTLSLDDFVVTFFNNGVGTSTLPIFVYGMLKRRISPEINAISTLMLVASTLLVGFSLALQGRNARRR